MKSKLIAMGMLCVGLGSQLIAAEDNRPNILFILADDQRNTSLGCAGHPQIKTPNIDALAEKGVRFENAFVTTAICMASRATIFTGLTTTSHGSAGGPSPSIPVQKADVNTSFPLLLRDAGYKTGFYGKQHVSFAAGVNGMDMMFDSYEKLFRNPFLKKMPDGSMRHVDEIVGDKSVDFIKKHNQKSPFFLYMSFNIAHAEDRDRRPGYHFQWPAAEDGLYEDIEPIRPDLDDPKYYDAAPEFLRTSMNRIRYMWRWDTPEKYRINMRAMYRMITGMDRIIGRAITALKETGQYENTIIIYSADNGFYMGDRGFAGKWSHYEQSLRVPLIVFDPRSSSNLQGRVVQQKAVNLDIPSTILDRAGIDIPKKYQGYSLTPILDGEVPADWRTDFYCEHHHNNETIPKYRGVRDERYTYAHYFEEGVELLYDREKDPTQLVDVSGNPEYKSVLNGLREKCEEYVEKYTRAEIVALKEIEKTKSTMKNRNSKKRKK